MGKRMDRYAKKGRFHQPPLQRSMPRQKQKKKSGLLATFFKIVLSILFIFCIGAGGAAFAYYKITGVFQTEQTQQGQATEKQPTSSTAKDTSLLDALKKKDIKLNVAVFGVDGDGTRTDVMFVAHFDSEKQMTNLVSLPRDTRVEIIPAVTSEMKQKKRYYQSPTKLNAVHAFAGKEDGCKMLVQQLESMLGIEIDHYVKVDLDAFRKIVDTIGGVEVNVPQDMYYKDPVQNLVINLKAGRQVLDGDKAEQLVRFRSYKMGDIARVEVQQQFLKAFAKKVTSSDTIIKNIPGYIEMLYSDVETDVTLSDALKYVNYVNMVDPNKIKMELLPGVPQDIDKTSYYIYNEEETKKMVDRIFFGIGLDEEEETGDSREYRIEVANGGYTEGLAGRVRDYLQEEGYNISGVSTYTGAKKEYTRIIVKEKGIGGDLKEYFKDAKVELDEENLLPADIDIKIIIGTEQTNI